VRRIPAVVCVGETGELLQVSVSASDTERSVHALLGVTEETAQVLNRGCMIG
jgi:hypothetical protein